jgi:hypothetical protein
VGVPYPQYAPKHFELELCFRIFSGGQRPSHAGEVKVFGNVIE